MRRVVNRTLKVIPATLYGATVLMATVPLSQAGSTIAGNLAFLGLPAPEFLKMASADKTVLIWSSVAFVLYIALLILTRDRKRSFEDVGSWSVSIHAEGAGWPHHFEDYLGAFASVVLDLRNLSATQSRALDFTATFTTGNPEQPLVRVGAAAGPHQPMRDQIARSELKPGVKERVLKMYPELPLELPPNSTLKCNIMFGIPAKIADTIPVGKLGLLEVEVHDRRSAQSRKVGFGEVYDAMRQKRYRGEIGLNYDGLRFRWMQYQLSRARKRKVTTIYDA